MSNARKRATARTEPRANKSRAQPLEIAHALREFLPGVSAPEAWYLQLSFNEHGDVAPGATFEAYIAMLPRWLAERPQLLQLFSALEAYGTGDCSGYMARKVEDIAHKRVPLPSVLKPWKTLRELLYHHGECGLIERRYTKPGWLNAPGPFSLVKPELRNLKLNARRMFK